MPVVTAIKSVKQPFQSTPELSQLMETFKQMINDCIRMGLGNNTSMMKKLSNLAYKQLASYDIMSYYKLCAISHAAGILANRKKSIKRGMNPRQPYATKPLLVSCYGFKVIDGILKVPLGKRQYFDIPLNDLVSCLENLLVWKKLWTCKNNFDMASVTKVLVFFSA